MDKIKEFFKNPIYVGVIGLVVGTIFGLVALGWGIWPVQWTDAEPAALQSDYRKDYLCMTINSYIANQDTKVLAVRWEGLGNEAQAVLDGLTPADCNYKSSVEIDAFKQVLSLETPSDLVTEEVKPTDGKKSDKKDVSATEIPEEEPAETKTISILPLAILILLTLVVGGILVFLLMKRSKKGAFSVAKAVKKVVQPKGAAKEGTPAADSKPGKKSNEPVLAQFMTTYRQGDDLYDDSFSIDSVNGEFLGECGVGIAETIGVGEPKKVTALEVWLFDKNDIQTVTKVLMSEHASNDTSLRQRLLSKGDTVLVEPGMQFKMETAKLELEARVIDMVYARGPLPENSYFSRLTLEVSVTQK